MRCGNKLLLHDDPRFFQDITSTAVEVGLSSEALIFVSLPKKLSTTVASCRETLSKSNRGSAGAAQLPDEKFHHRPDILRAAFQPIIGFS